jgi:hypothetical protein
MIEMEEFNDNPPADENEKEKIIPKNENGENPKIDKNKGLPDKKEE